MISLNFKKINQVKFLKFPMILAIILTSKNLTMKVNVITISIFAMLLFACNSTPKNNVTSEKEEPLKEEIKIENTLISSNSVGEFNIGEEISAKNYSIEESVITRMDEGEEWTEPVFNISENESPLMVLKPKYDFETNDYTKNIGEIVVIASKFKTEKGIGVNATISEFIAQYPNYNISFTYIGGDMFVIETPDLNAWFLLDENGYTKEIQVTGEATLLKFGDFKPDTKIVKIRCNGEKLNTFFK